MRLIGVLLLLTGAVLEPGPDGQASDTLHVVRMMLFGDVNLGRSVGRSLLKGDSDHPFDRVKGELRNCDIVFANLESPISDQKGETEDPRSNTIFCAPPVAARVLREAHVTVVSTSNNHAYDYGMRGIRETRRFLDSAGVSATGTSEYLDSLWNPLVIEQEGIRLGFVACTQFVNIAGPWKDHIALFDKEKLLDVIGRLKGTVDVVIASYHGGREYADSIDAELLSNLRFLVDAGADVVVAHHSHVPQGIILYKHKFIFPSLGNFVFIQPQRDWTQRSYSVQLTFHKRHGTTSLGEMELRPFRVSGQPTFGLSATEMRTLIERLRKLSNVPLVEQGSGFRVQLQGLASNE